MAKPSYARGGRRQLTVRDLDTRRTSRLAVPLHSCSLPCFRTHKETCPGAPQDAAGETTASAGAAGGGVAAAPAPAVDGAAAAVAAAAAGGDEDEDEGDRVVLADMLTPEQLGRLGESEAVRRAVKDTRLQELVRTIDNGDDKSRLRALEAAMRNEDFARFVQTMLEAVGDGDGAQ